MQLRPGAIVSFDLLEVGLDDLDACRSAFAKQRGEIGRCSGEWIEGRVWVCVHDERGEFPA